MGDAAPGESVAERVAERELPVAIYPLIRMTGDRPVMGRLRSARSTTLLSWVLFAVIVEANLWLMAQLFAA